MRLRLIGPTPFSKAIWVRSKINSMRFKRGPANAGCRRQPTASKIHIFILRREDPFQRGFPFCVALDGDRKRAIKPVRFGCLHQLHDNEQPRPRINLTSEFVGATEFEVPLEHSVLALERLHPAVIDLIQQVNPWMAKLNRLRLNRLSRRERLLFFS